MDDRRAMQMIAYKVTDMEAEHSMEPLAVKIDAMREEAILANSDKVLYAVRGCCLGHGIAWTAYLTIGGLESSTGTIHW
jgi:hypothetical protein